MSLSVKCPVCGGEIRDKPRRSEVSGSTGSAASSARNVKISLTFMRAQSRS
ncbi:MAG: hypothetical protein QXU67_04120 [Candidatus Bathyarchaeia archaeon]